jgi:DNA-binding CsgD family transcriptional regulator
MEVSIRTWLYEKLAASNCERDRHALIALLRLGESRANDRGVADRLTNAEQLVCAALRAHPSHTTRALAAVLNRSPNTVHNQIFASMQKLGVSRRAALVAVDVRANCPCASCAS